MRLPLPLLVLVLDAAAAHARRGKEVKKWLGPERLKCMQLSQGADVIAQQVNDFKLGKVWRLLIGSYEQVRASCSWLPHLLAAGCWLLCSALLTRAAPSAQLRKHGPALAGCCDVLVCDEGHRLKATGGNKTIAGLQALGCDRRIVL